jgi:hypothetical protein
MKRTLLKSKIHRAKVTDADLNYEGSVTVDLDLLDAADIVEHEQVDIYDITNGARLTTYAIPGRRGSGGRLGHHRQLRRILDRGNRTASAEHCDGRRAQSGSCRDRTGSLTVLGTNSRIRPKLEPLFGLVTILITRTTVSRRRNTSGRTKSLVDRARPKSPGVAAQVR